MNAFKIFPLLHPLSITLRTLLSTSGERAYLEVIFQGVLFYYHPVKQSVTGTAKQHPNHFHCKVTLGRYIWWMLTFKGWLTQTVPWLKRERKSLMSSTISSLFRGLGQIRSLSREHLGIPWWFSGKESPCQCKRHRFNIWSRKIPRALQ